MIKTRLRKIHSHRDRLPKSLQLDQGHLTMKARAMCLSLPARRRFRRVEEAKMSAQPLPQVDDSIYAVRQWKETIDPSAKWWQKWFHRFIYLPFNEFTLKVIKLPPATSVTVEGSKVTFSWLEDGGFFASEDQADFACLTERYSYQRITFGRAFGPESAQVLGPTIFPRATRPRKRAKPVLEMIINPRR
jgi:hypothetical protein